MVRAGPGPGNLFLKQEEWCSVPEKQLTRGARCELGSPRRSAILLWIFPRNCCYSNKASRSSSRTLQGLIVHDGVWTPIQAGHTGICSAHPLSLIHLLPLLPAAPHHANQHQPPSSCNPAPSVDKSCCHCSTLASPKEKPGI